MISLPAGACPTTAAQTQHVTQHAERLLGLLGLLGLLLLGPGRRRVGRRLSLLLRERRRRVGRRLGRLLGELLLRELQISASACLGLSVQPARCQRLLTASGGSGGVAWKQEESKGIVAIGENVECTGNNTVNTAFNAEYRAHEGGTFPGLPDHLVRFT